jgi:hypothetical protein
MIFPSTMHAGLQLVACSLVAGCATVNEDRFPASISMVGSQQGAAIFIAQSAQWHQLHLVLQRGGLSFSEVLCLLGGTLKKADPCQDGEHPIGVKWAIYSIGEMKQVSSGWSSPSMSDPSQFYYTDEWASRNMGGFVPVKGMAYEVRVEISAHASKEDRAKPTVLVRVPTPNVW